MKKNSTKKKTKNTKKKPKAKENLFYFIMLSELSKKINHLPIL
jgi:hypothetical protein